MIAATVPWDAGLRGLPGRILAALLVPASPPLMRGVRDAAQLPDNRRPEGGDDLAVSLPRAAPRGLHERDQGAEVLCFGGQEAGFPGSGVRGAGEPLGGH